MVVQNIICVFAHVTTSFPLFLYIYGSVAAVSYGLGYGFVAVGYCNVGRGSPEALAIWLLGLVHNYVTQD
jgi:hypothetical protein